MKIRTSLQDRLPLPYWTGILGGIIYVVWTGINFALRSFPYYGRSILVRTFFAMLDLPTLLQSTVSGWFIDRALERAGSVYTVPYRIVGHVISFGIFVLVGIILGIRSSDPKREARRKRLLAASLALIILLWFLGSCVLTLIASMLD